MKKRQFFVIALLFVFIGSGCSRAEEEKQTARKTEVFQEKRLIAEKKENTEKIKTAEVTLEPIMEDLETEAEKEISIKTQVGGTKTLEFENDWEKEEFIELGYKKAPEYETLGIGCFIDNNGRLRGCYLPYGGNVTLYLDKVLAMNHGVSILLAVFDVDSASEVLKELKNFLNTNSSLSYENLKVGEIKTEDNDTVGLFQFSYYTEFRGERVRTLSLIYADITEDGYMVARVDFVPTFFDDTTPKLLEELQDCYALYVPGITEITEDTVWPPEKH